MAIAKLSSALLTSNNTSCAGAVTPAPSVFGAVAGGSPGHAHGTSSRPSESLSIEQLYDALRGWVEANDRENLSQIFADLVRRGRPISEIAGKVQALVNAPGQDQSEPTRGHPPENPSQSSHDFIGQSLQINVQRTAEPKLPADGHHLVIRAVEPELTTDRNCSNDWPAATAASVDTAADAWPAERLFPLASYNRATNTAGFDRSVEGTSAPLSKAPPELGSVRHSIWPAATTAEPPPSEKALSCLPSKTLVTALAAGAVVVGLSLLLLMPQPATDAGSIASRGSVGALGDGLARRAGGPSDDFRPVTAVAEEIAPVGAPASNLVQTAPAPASSPPGTIRPADIVGLNPTAGPAPSAKTPDPIPAATPEERLWASPAPMALSSPVVDSAAVQEPKRDWPNDEAPNESSPASPAAASNAVSSAAPLPSVSAVVTGPSAGPPKGNTKLVSLEPTEAAPNGVRLAPAADAAAQERGRSQLPTPAQAALLLERADRLFAARDITSARLFYERAAEAGDSQAALRLGGTYDPAFLQRVRLRLPGDPTLAAFWYRRAQELGAIDAEVLLNGMQIR